jgi:ribosomal protein L11 methyltransferase
MRTWPAIDVGRLREPDLLQAALVDYDVAAIDERSPDSWTVFFHTAAERDRAAHTLTAGFPELRLEAVDVADEDWAARSQAELQAVRVDDLVVAPPWDLPDMSRIPGPGPTVVVIQPSMGFGTGHHATTRLCLAALQRVPLRDKAVLDVGTGSGVLAIAASLLGASPVVAIDDDPDAVASARENAARNGAPIDIFVADLRTSVLPRVDLVLANLTGALLMQSAGRLQDLTSSSASLILSGFQHHEEAGVLAAFPELRLTDRGQEDDWVSVTLQHEGAFE